MKPTRSTAPVRRSLRATARCPYCARLVRLGGVTGTVVLPHTTKPVRVNADGETVGHAGPPCPASCTRLPRQRGAPMPPHRGAPIDPAGGVA